MTDTTTPKKSGYSATRPKVPPFARFEGTSAWRKDRRRAREYARYRATTKAAQGALHTR